MFNHDSHNNKQNNDEEWKKNYLTKFIVENYNLSNVPRYQIEETIARIIVQDIHNLTINRMMEISIKEGFFNGKPIIDVKRYCLERLLSRCSFGLDLTNDQIDQMLSIFTASQLLSVNEKMDDKNHSWY